MLWTMGEDQQFVLGVEVNQVFTTLLFCQNLPPPFQSEDSLNEIVSELRIMETPILLHRQKRKMLHEGSCKHAHPLLDRP